MSLPRFSGHLDCGDEVAQKGVQDGHTIPQGVPRAAVELAWLREKAVTQIASDLGISDQTLRNWVKQADIDEGRRDGLTTEERAETSKSAGREARTPSTHGVAIDSRNGGALPLSRAVPRK